MDPPNSEMEKINDIAVIGSGFGGSITAMGLKNLGYKVCLIEKKSHPRFAIGESSTPIADMILRDIADEYTLPFLKQISRYGEWQKYYPEVRCGLKRGFSYYHHLKKERFETDSDHNNELLVAASIDDHHSDTNWLRSDVDHFLIKKAVELGVDYYEKTEVVQLDRSDDTGLWSVRTKIGELITDFKVKWIIDATGSGEFSAKNFNTSNDLNEFKTDSVAIYSHFKGVPMWSDYLQNRKISTVDYPYEPDDSALHQIIDEGWIWMLRFTDGLLSCGLVLDNTPDKYRLGKVDPNHIWRQTIEQYPSISKVLKSAVYAEQPGKLIYSGRLQRKLNRMFGDGWVALNHTAGFVDPMHSTGIAFTLLGIERLLKLFRDRKGENIEEVSLRLIQDKTFKELKFIDILVSMTYRSRWNTELFTAAVMLYFVASVEYEQRRLGGMKQDLFLSADHHELTDIIEQIYHKIVVIEKNNSISEAKELITEISRLIEPFNRVGLLNASNKNMYRHTAVTM